MAGLFFFIFWLWALGAPLAGRLSVCFRSRHGGIPSEQRPFFCFADGATCNELTIDRLFAVSELGLVAIGEVGRRRGFEEAGGGAFYLAGYRSKLRTIVIFALIHQPILSLSLVALAAQVCEAEIYVGVTSAVNRFIDCFWLAFLSA